MIDRAYLEQVLLRLEGIERELAEPGAASDRRRYREKLTEHARLQDLRENAEAYLAMVAERDGNQHLIDEPGIDEDLRELARAEQAELASRLDSAEKALRLALLPPNPDDSRNILVEIRAGTGGEEAALFAADLHRMYERFAESMGWTASAIDANPTSIGGFKEIVFAIEGTDVYRLMKYESGVHRVQRVPATEAQGRIHTSAATVAVLPEADDLEEIAIKADDLRVDTYRASGAGGQHVNKTDSAVRITHLPSGLVVQSQDERSQHRNREKAMRVLRAKLYDLQREAAVDRQADTRRSQVGSGDRSERIRTYNFPQNRVTDHRIGLTLYSLDRVMAGELTDLITALYEGDMAKQLRRQIDGGGFPDAVVDSGGGAA